MIEASPRQKKYAASLIVRACEPLTADEAGHLIRDLRREETAFPDLLEGIITADNGNDKERLGHLLASAKRRVKHGAWLRTLDKLGISHRRAQRLMAKT